MKKGFVVINAYSKQKQVKEQVDRLQEEFAKKGIVLDIFRNDSMQFMMDKQGQLFTDYQEYDFCIYLDKDKYRSQMIEKTGCPMFNCHQAIAVCDDKMETYLALMGNHIAMPKTIPGLLCYNKDEKIKEKTVREVEQSLGYPLIMKECYGSLGKGVYQITCRDELLEKMEELKCKEHIFQEMIISSKGKDVRVIVVGKKAVGAMLRQSEDDFRSNIDLNGTGSGFALTDELIKQSEKVAEILQLDYCGIDWMFGPDQMVLCEVNSNAFFHEFERVTHINVAEQYVSYICEQIGNKHCKE